MNELDRVFQTGADIRYRNCEGEGVVVHQGAGEVIMLNETGASVLDLSDGEHSVSDIVDALAADYAVNHDILVADVLSYVAELVEAGVLSPAEQDAGPA